MKEIFNRLYAFFLRTKKFFSIFFLVVLSVSSFVLANYAIKINQENRSQAASPNPFLKPGGLNRTFFNRKDILYSSQIPSWPQQEGRYDGQYMLNYNSSCPTCPQLAIDTKMPVVRWMVWSPFPNQTDPRTNQAGTMTEEQFNNVINGIRNTLSAQPFISFQPIAFKEYCPDTWGINNLMKMNKEIIRVAGNRVQLYEIANEPDIDCEWATYAGGKGGQGAKIADYWIKMAPELKKYARSLGFEIYMGGPAFFTSRVSAGISVPEMQNFLTVVRNEYNRTQDRDLVPDFISFHIFGDSSCTQETGKTLNDIPNSCLDDYGPLIDAIQNVVNTAWAGSGFRPRLAVTGYNVSVSWLWDSNQIELIATRWYERFLPLLRSKNVFMANLVKMASKEGSRMDLIRNTGETAVYYDTFKTISLNDPLAKESRNSLATPIPTPTKSPSSTPTPPSKPGDLNGDGKVNILDYTLLFEYFGKDPKPKPSVDINKDGQVNILDYVLLFEHFGK